MVKPKSFRLVAALTMMLLMFSATFSIPGSWAADEVYTITNVSEPDMLELVSFDLTCPPSIADDTKLTLNYTGEGGISHEGPASDTITTTVTDGKITGLVVQDVTGTLTITPADGDPVTIDGITEGNTGAVPGYDPIASGSITGTVLNSSGNPIAGTNITIAGTEYKTQTGPDGSYTIVNIPAGTYTIKVVKFGFNSSSVTDITVTAGETTAGIDFDLIAVPQKVTVEQAKIAGQRLSAGSSHSLALQADGTVVAWGSNRDGKCDVPDGLDNVVAVAATALHSLALQDNGIVVVWGTEWDKTCDVPDGLDNVVAIATGADHFLALKNDGTVVAWGRNEAGQCNVPDKLDNIVAIAAGIRFSLALKNDGTVVAWGCGNWNNESDVPADLDDVIAIAAGSHSLALQADGTIVAWGGSNYYGECDVPADLDNVIAVAAGSCRSLALKNDGTIVAWGAPSEGFDNNSIIAMSISRNNSHTLVLKTDGTVGDIGIDQGMLFGEDYNQLLPPDNLNLAGQLQQLSINQSSLLPAFDPDQLTYTVDVASDITAIEITAETNPGFALTVNDQAQPNGEPASIDLAVGPNLVNISVTEPATGLTRTYTVTITRAEPDVTPPAWQDGFPTKSNIAYYSFDLNLKTDENAVTYYVVLSSNAPAPTAAEVKAGTGRGGASAVKAGQANLAADVAEVVNINGLNANKQYGVYLTAQDVAGNMQPTPVLVTVTTATPPPPPPPPPSYYLSTVTLAGELPALTAGDEGFDLSNLTVSGKNQYGQPYSINGWPITWRITSGSEFVTLEGNTLIPLAAGTGTITATVGDITSKPVDFTVNPVEDVTPPEEDWFINHTITNETHHSFDLNLTAKEDVVVYYLVQTGWNTPNASWKEIIAAGSGKGEFGGLAGKVSLAAGVTETVKVYGLDNASWVNLSVVQEEEDVWGFIRVWQGKMLCDCCYPDPETVVLAGEIPALTAGGEGFYLNNLDLSATDRHGCFRSITDQHFYAINWQITSGNEFATIKNNTLIPLAAGTGTITATIAGVTSNPINFTINPSNDDEYQLCSFFAPIKGVSENHQLQIPLDQEVDLTTITPANVFICRAGTTERHPVTIEVTSGNEAITVVPITPYAAGGSYQLYIANAKNKVGQTLEPIRMPFAITAPPPDENGFASWARNPIEPVPADKQWRIKFNKELDPTTVNESAIFVCWSGTGDRHPIRIELTEQTGLTIIPLRPYTVGASYTLFIDSSIKCKDGTNLSKGIKLPFEINTQNNSGFGG